MRYRYNVLRHTWVGVVTLMGLAAVAFLPIAAADDAATNHLLTIYDRGSERSIISSHETIRDALKAAGVAIDPNDIVEPGLDEELVAKSYQVNIYRARPITIVDGTTKIRIMSAYQTSRQIADHAGITLQDEDRTTMRASEDVITNGVSSQLAIDRATPLTLVLYGKEETVYTQATTVGEMLKEKNIMVAKNDTVSVALSKAVTRQMRIEIWRDGVQTVTVDEPIEPPVETIQDANREVGYRAVKDKGVAGKRSVTYEIVRENGKELSRTRIQDVVITQPKKRIVVIGAKTSDNPLTKAMGVNHFTDSNGVTHRETYYDLPMNVVMNACGAGGVYSVRSTDGAKIDKDGYIIIAAHLGNYPRCSVVETSMGLGKVYDTGGFTARHPHGFDLATDWTNNDGR